MRGRLTVHETGFPRKNIFTPSFIDGRVLFRIFIFNIVFNDLWVRLCKYTKNKGLDSREITSKTWWTWRVISINAENKPHAHHKTHLHTMKVYNTRPVGLTIKVLLIKILLFSTTKVITFRKSSTSLILCKLSMHTFRHAATLAYL